MRTTLSRWVDASGCGERLAFEADWNDHCETDVSAYRHLVLLLRHVARLTGYAVAEDSPRCELRIWDPYYCRGASARLLASLGFPQVHNVNEDFYAVAAERRCPVHDVLVSNPPYSGDHIERCTRFCATSKRPWCLLLPNWVHAKPWYKDMAEHGAFGALAPFFLGPVRKAYNFRIPEGAWRPEHVGSDGRTTPYLASWFVHVPDAEASRSLFGYLEREEARQSDWAVSHTLDGVKAKARRMRAPARQGFKFK